MSGKKYDEDKPDLVLLPAEGLIEVTNVLMFGAKKYGRDNWRELDEAQLRYTNAALRHLVAYGDGEVRDPESGLLHVAHAAASCLFMADLLKRG